MNLTQEEINKLKEAAGNDQEWNKVCDEIKAARGGQYPPDWWKVVVIMGGSRRPICP